MKLFILLIILLFTLADLIMVIYVLSLLYKFKKTNLEFHKTIGKLLNRMSKNSLEKENEND